MKPMLNVSRQNAESSIACSWELHARTTSYQSPFSGFSGLDMSRESPILLTVLSSLTDCADYGASSEMHLKICCCIVEPVEAFRCLPPQPSSLGLHLPKEHISSVFLRCPFLLPQITTSPALCIFHTKSEATCMLKALPRFARASCGNYFVDPFFEVSHIITHLGNGITIRYNTILLSLIPSDSTCMFSSFSSVNSCSKSLPELHTFAASTAASSLFTTSHRS